MTYLPDAHEKKVINDYLLYSQEQLKVTSPSQSTNNPQIRSSRSTARLSTLKKTRHSKKTPKQCPKKERSQNRTQHSMKTLRNTEKTMKKSKEQLKYKNQITNPLNKNSSLNNIYERCITLMQSFQRKCWNLEIRNKQLKKQNKILRLKSCH